MKTCRKCGEEKPLDAFYAGRHQCKRCRDRRYNCPICSVPVSKRGSRCLLCYEASDRAPRPMVQPKPRVRQVYRCEACGKERNKRSQSGLCVACYDEAIKLKTVLCVQCKVRPVPRNRSYCGDCWDDRSRARAAASDATMVQRNKRYTHGYGLRHYKCQVCQKPIWAFGTCYTHSGKPINPAVVPIWERGALAV